jgi:hypothetical protein
MEQGIRQRLRRALWRPYQAARRLQTRGIFKYRYLRRADALRCRSALTEGTTVDDATLVDGIIANYRSGAASGDSMWRGFFADYHADIDDALRNGPRERIERMLRDPATCDLFYGFESLGRFLLHGAKIGQRLEDRRAPEMALDALLGFAETLGVRRLANPEDELQNQASVDPDALLASIDRALGVALPVPNPFRGEFGLATSRGVVTYRVPQAMYQAWRIRKLAGVGARVLEIGAGLGRTALYAHALGISDYTLVDIPISTVAQRYFLGRCGVPAKFMAPEEFLRSTERYDLIVNVDSLTEMDRAIAEGYVEAIRARAGAFLSINHESNAFTVRELVGGMSRHPYWLRRGYVEEVVHFS